MKGFKLLFFLLLCTGASAQKLANCTGATINNGIYVLEYAIGEVAIATLSAANNDVTQGLLQPTIKVQQPDCEMINAGIAFFENPTKDKLRLVGIYDWVKSYQIFAADGRLVRSQNFYNNYIDVSGLPAAGIYFIRLMPGCNGKYNIIKFMKR